MEGIRLATEAEISRVAERTDFVPGCEVWALDNRSGSTNLAVVRNCIEIDPYQMAEDAPRSKKVEFIYALESGLKMRGIPVYFFSVDADAAEWQQTVENWGAEKVSAVPQLRYRRILHGQFNQAKEPV